MVQRSTGPCFAATRRSRSSARARRELARTAYVRQRCRRDAFLGVTNQPRDDGDWVSCARAMLAHGLQRATVPQGEDSQAPRYVLIDGREMAFSPEVTEVRSEFTTRT